MKATIEFRIPEAYAREYLDKTDGVCLGGSVRKLVVTETDALFAKVGRLDCDFRARGKAFFTSWMILRKYSPHELANAQAFQLNVKRIIEPAGIECGTAYDESGVCTFCGAGARQVSDLVLDARSLPKQQTVGVAKTLSGELIASAVFVQIAKSQRIVGVDFRDIRQRGNTEVVIQNWQQIVLASSPVSVVAPTQIGTTPFEKGETDFHGQESLLTKFGIAGSWCDQAGNYRCPLGHTIGLNILSELSVSKVEFDVSDIAVTKQCVGVRRGLLRPEPLIVVSPRVRQTIVDNGVTGVKFEIAHLV